MIFRTLKSYSMVTPLVGLLVFPSEIARLRSPCFPQNTKDEVELYSTKVQEAHEARELFDGVYTMGELEGVVKEQPLVVKNSLLV